MKRMTQEQMKMFLTRLGLGSKAVVTGDPSQVDLPKNQKGLIKIAYNKYVPESHHRVDGCRCGTSSIGVSNYNGRMTRLDVWGTGNIQWIETFTSGLCPVCGRRFYPLIFLFENFPRTKKVISKKMLWLWGHLVYRHRWNGSPHRR